MKSEGTKPMKISKSLFAAAAAGSLLCSAGAQSVPEQNPNIILILADDLGYGDLGCYGCSDIETPNLDRLAESGIRLTDGYVTHPYCGPSRAGLMTGRYQQRHGFWKNPPVQHASHVIGLDVDEETMGDVLTRAGYRTAYYGKWHLGASEPFHPTNRGFHEFYGFLGGGHCFFPTEYEEKMTTWANNPKPVVPELYGYATPLEINGITLPPQEGYLTDLLTTHAISFMNGVRNDPFFLFMAYNAPHVPLEAPESYLKKYSHIQDENRRTYAAMVDNLDWNIGQLLEALEEAGKRENTLIVFLSDNGGPTSQTAASNGPLRGAKGDVSEGGVRVPFIFNWPNTLPSGKELTVPISSLDLLPTFAALIGENPAGKPLDGVDVLPWLQGTASGTPHERLMWMNPEMHQLGMRAGDFKITQMGADKPWQLFNLSKDISEKRNLAQSMAEKTKTMATECTEWQDSLPASRWASPRVK
jgi:arylsulfatase A-like enzyme